MTRLLVLALLALAGAVGVYAAVSTSAADGHGRTPVHRVTIDPPGGTPGPP